jgi:RNA polymerase sigma-70 factor, ECF subfamily
MPERTAEFPPRRRAARAVGQPCVSDGDPSFDQLFAELYERYFRRVHRYFRTVLGDPYEAEDAAHEVFVKVLRALRRCGFEGQQHEAWLFRIARNHAIDVHRWRRLPETEDPRVIELHAERSSVQLAPGEFRASPAASQEEFLILLAGLPIAQRQVLALHYLYGMKTADIAEVLARTPENVRVLEHRALSALRARLAPAAERTRAVLGMQRWRLPRTRTRLHVFTLRDTRSWPLAA